MYLKNGEVHHSGVNNEHNVIEILNSTDNAITTHLKNKHGEDCRIKHKGGTQGVDDALVVGQDDMRRAGISIKNHKTGTHDWINTTKIPNKESIKTPLQRFKETYPDITVEVFNEKEKTLREERDNIVNQYLRDLSGGYIKNMLSDLYEGYSEYVIVNHITNEEYICYEKNTGNFKEFVGFPHWDYYLKFTKAKNSAMIWRKHPETGEEVCTNLRLRITLNNGLNAFFGISEKNKTSVPCLKLQQDSVDKHLESLINKIIVPHAVKPSALSITAETSEPLKSSPVIEVDTIADAKADAKVDMKAEVIEEM